MSQNAWNWGPNGEWAALARAGRLPPPPAPPPRTPEAIEAERVRAAAQAESAAQTADAQRRLPTTREELLHLVQTLLSERPRGSCAVVREVLVRRLGRSKPGWAEIDRAWPCGATDVSMMWGHGETFLERMPIGVCSDGRIRVISRANHYQAAPRTAKALTKSMTVSAALPGDNADGLLADEGLVLLRCRDHLAAALAAPYDDTPFTPVTPGDMPLAEPKALSNRQRMRISRIQEAIGRRYQEIRNLKYHHGDPDQPDYAVQRGAGPSRAQAKAWARIRAYERAIERRRAHIARISGN
ncbi:MAG TPA: hypothetical protein VIJ96_19700 [Acidothermaceae bacterium]